MKNNRGNIKNISLILLIILSISQKSESQISSNLDSLKCFDDFNVNHFQKGDTVMLGLPYGYSARKQYSQIKYYKSRKLRKYGYVSRDLSFNTFTIKRVGSEKKFLKDVEDNNKDLYIRFGKKGLISRKDYFANLNYAIKSREIVLRLANSSGTDNNQYLNDSILFLYYLKSNDIPTERFAEEYHYRFMKNKYKIDGFWEGNPEYEKLLKLGVKTMNETLNLVDFNKSYTFNNVFLIKDYSLKKKGFFIAPKDSIQWIIIDYEEAPGIGIVFKNIKDYSFLSVEENFASSFLNRRTYKDNIEKRIYAKVNFKFLDISRNKTKQANRIIYTKIESIEFYEYQNFKYNWLGTINSK